MQNNIRVINIKEVVKKLVSAWKIILLVGIGVGVIFVASTLLKEEVNIEPITDSEEQIEPVTEEKLYDWQKKDVEKLLYVYSRIAYYDKYLEDSIIFNIRDFIKDYKLRYAKVQFYISIEKKQDVINYNYYQENILKMYEEYIESAEFAECFREVFNVDENIDIVHMQDMINVENSGGMLYIYVCLTEEGSEEQIYSLVKECVNNKKAIFDQLVKHEMLVVDEQVVVVCSEEVNDKMTEIKKGAADARQELSSKFSKLSIAEKKYLKEILFENNFGKYANNIAIPSSEMLEKEEDTNVIDVIQGKVKFEIKSAIIVLVAGMMGMIMLFIIKFIFSGKIQFTDDLFVSYGIYQFGSIRIDEKFINKKEQVYKEQIEKVSEAVRLYCVSRNIDNLLIYGGIELTDIEKIAAIREVLRKHQINIEIVSYKQDASMALKMAVENKNVIIVEAVDESKYRDIELQLAMLEKYDVNVIGGVMLTKY
jgi:hypothetical protein